MLWPSGRFFFKFRAVFSCALRAQPAIGVRTFLVRVPLWFSKFRLASGLAVVPVIFTLFDRAGRPPQWIGSWAGISLKSDGLQTLQQEQAALPRISAMQVHDNQLRTLADRHASHKQCSTRILQSETVKRCVARRPFSETRRNAQRTPRSQLSTQASLAGLERSHQPPPPCPLTRSCSHTISPARTDT